MKRLPLLLLLFTILPSLQCNAATKDRFHQELSIRLIPAEHRLEAQITMTMPGRDTGWPVAFRLAPQSEIISFAADGHPVPYIFDKGELRWSPRVTVQEVVLSYSARYDDSLPTQMVGIEDPSYGIRGTIQPQGAFLSGSTAWHPIPIDTGGTFRVTIKGPGDLTGVTAGRLDDLQTNGKETLITWEGDQALYPLTLAAGHYRVFQEQLGAIQLFAFLTVENTQLAPGYLDACRDYLTFYQGLFGPYPYAKFAVVENFFPTGYGLPGWTLLGSTVIRLPFILTTSLPHEIAHAWWGNAVEVDFASGNWCEGLATYVADYLLKERRSPAEAQEYRLKLLRDYATLVDVKSDYPLRDFRSRKSKADQAIGYGKAAMVFHMLRHQLGDETFWRGLQEVAKNDIGKKVSWSDLERRFEEVSGQGLSDFFAQWIDRAGAPRLSLADASLEQNPDGWEVSGLILQQPPFYMLDVALRINDEPDAQDQQLLINGAQTPFRMVRQHRPGRLTADPDSNLFRRLSEEEIPVTVNALRAAGQPRVVIASGTDPELLKASNDLLLGLHWQDAPVSAERDLTADQLADDDLLFIGWPQRHTSLIAPQMKISVTAQNFAIDDIIFKNTNDALFVALSKTGGSHGVVGIFMPLSPAAAQSVSRKIAHYGRYSYLAFSDGTNRLKGTWSPRNSPLSVMLEEGQL